MDEDWILPVCFSHFFKVMFAVNSTAVPRGILLHFFLRLLFFLLQFELYLMLTTSVELSSISMRVVIFLYCSWIKEKLLISLCHLCLVNCYDECIMVKNFQNPSPIPKELILERLFSAMPPMILPGYQTSNSASISKFMLALLVALVLHEGDSADFDFAIL